LGFTPPSQTLEERQGEVESPLALSWSRDKTARAVGESRPGGPLLGARRVAFISADDDGAKKQVETLLEGFGYSVIDLGDLRDGGLIQQAGGPLAGRDLLEKGERHK